MLRVPLLNNDVRTLSLVRELELKLTFCLLSYYCYFISSAIRNEFTRKEQDALAEYLSHIPEQDRSANKVFVEWDLKVSHASFLITLLHRKGQCQKTTN